MTGSLPILSLEDVSWSVGGFHILTDVKLEVREGEILSIIGPNGAGKSSLINLITGVLRPTSGRIVFDGWDITGLAAHRRSQAGMARTFQTAHVFESLSALENCRVAAQAQIGGSSSLWRRPRPTDEAIEAGRRALVAVGLDDQADVPAVDLSHGNRRRLELALVLTMKPKLLLLDEPSAGIANEQVPGLMDLIRRVRDGGVTVILVEHHMEAVAQLSDRVAVLHQGSILMVDSPSAVLSDATVRRAYLGAAAS